MSDGTHSIDSARSIIFVSWYHYFVSRDHYCCNGYLQLPYTLRPIAHPTVREMYMQHNYATVSSSFCYLYPKCVSSSMLYGYYTRTRSSQLFLVDFHLLKVHSPPAFILVSIIHLSEESFIFDRTPFAPACFAIQFLDYCYYT